MLRFDVGDVVGGERCVCGRRDDEAEMAEWIGVGQFSAREAVDCLAEGFDGLLGGLRPGKVVPGEVGCGELGGCHGGSHGTALAVPGGYAAAKVRLRSRKDARRRKGVCGPGRMRGGRRCGAFAVPEGCAAARYVFWKVGKRLEKAPSLRDRNANASVTAEVRRTILRQLLV